MTNDVVWNGSLFEERFDCMDSKFSCDENILTQPQVSLTSGQTSTCAVKAAINKNDNNSKEVALAGVNSKCGVDTLPENSNSSEAKEIFTNKQLLISTFHHRYSGFTNTGKHCVYLHRYFYVCCFITNELLIFFHSRKCYKYIPEGKCKAHKRTYSVSSGDG